VKISAHRFLLFFLCCLTTLSLSRISSINDRMNNERGAVGGMKTGRRNGSTRKKTAHCHPARSLTFLN
jgi:hypothetical protein